MLGKAAVVFLSSHPQAFARGETAHHLLVVDELQDQDAAHVQAVGQGFPGQLGVFADEHLPGLTGLARRVHNDSHTAEAAASQV